MGLKNGESGTGFGWSVGIASVVISLVQLFSDRLGKLKYIYMYPLVSGVSVQDYQGSWGPCKGVTYGLSPSGMDSAGTWWAGGISPSSWMLG